LPLYYGWVNLLVAALAMTATLPGRTHGLGLITEPLLADLGISRGSFSALNFWAIILGSALCWPAGRLIDRVGARAVLVVIALFLGSAVLWMSRLADPLFLFIALTCVRGLGQGALSVVSMALVGKWFTRRLGPAMGLFAVLLAIGFIVTMLSLEQAVHQHGWRGAWAGLGWWLILGMAPVGLVLARSTPESCGLVPDAPTAAAAPEGRSMTLGQALRSPAFWSFTVAISCFNLTWSAVTLFNDSILTDLGFNEPVLVNGQPVRVFVLAMSAMTATGLLCNLLAGWIALHWPIRKLLATGMILFAATLAAFPFLQTVGQVILHGACLGVAGGIVTVAHFTAYPQLFGRKHLGQIQSVAQVVTVFASALGPVALTVCREETGSYELFFAFLAAAAGVLAILVASRGLRKGQ
jgi:MFS family permease